MFNSDALHCCRELARIEVGSNRHGYLNMLELHSAWRLL